MNEKTISPLTWHETPNPDTAPAAVILAGGDFCPIRRYEVKILNGEEIFDDELLECFGEKDFCLVNQEAVMCGKKLKPSSKAGYGLRCSTEVADYMKRIGIDAATLANNHIRDFRDEGVMSSIQALEAAGIKTCGAGANMAEANRPLFIRINDINICIWAIAEKELNIAGDKSPGAALFMPETNMHIIPELKRKSDFLLIYVHAGHEFMTTPSPRIRDSYRRFIDAGADLVAGHHPHVIQGIENYGGKWIIYSMGNLVFDSPYVSSYPLTDVGFLSRITVSRNNLRKLEIIPYRIHNSIVKHLVSREMKEFTSMLRKISSNITDDRKFESEWEQNVKRRWEKDYRRIMVEFSSRLFDCGNADSPRIMRNLFTCPTHAEIIEKISFLLEDGTLSRNTRTEGG